MEFGWVKAKYHMENPENLAVNPLKIPGKIVFLLLATLLKVYWES